MSSDTYVCPICQTRKNGENFHCPDHCMDMCRDHVRKTQNGRYICLVCDKPVLRLVHDGRRWVEK